MPIAQFLWPEDRVEHIAEHDVMPEEFEQVSFGRALILRAKARGENPVYYVLGETDSGRHLGTCSASSSSSLEARAIR